MTFDPNDPRLTAYLLGELDPADRAEIESMLEDSPEGRQAARGVDEFLMGRSDLGPKLKLF